ncbi:HAD family hydrolase [Nocardioides sp. GXQ0305]|uniref:HAD family hydrolase n=1 Tax=Nocardioides sp. GXQ0305 TaxID=3423912 RepID=UPI003D7D7426
MTAPVVTFDLFSALIDSRTGGSAALDELAHGRGWEVVGSQLYDAWDPRNKAAQRDCRDWVPWRVPARRAMTGAYEALALEGDPAEAVEVLAASMPGWPLWPDVATGLPLVREAGWRPGLLSSVDDDLFLSTAAAPLVDHEVALTSERLGVYKPHAAVYQQAVDLLGAPVHVPTSARDVRGALEAGIRVVRLRRPGHDLDPDGPRPHHEVDSTHDLPAALATLG